MRLRGVRSAQPAGGQARPRRRCFEAVRIDKTACDTAISSVSDAVGAHGVRGAGLKVGASDPPPSTLLR